MTAAGAIPGRRWRKVLFPLFDSAKLILDILTESFYNEICQKSPKAMMETVDLSQHMVQRAGEGVSPVLWDGFEDHS